MDGAPGTTLLRGLFPEAALMAHACRCTAHITVDANFRMCVYASVDIAAGQPITFNYTSSLLVSNSVCRYLHAGAGVNECGAVERERKSERAWISSSCLSIGSFYM